MLFAKKILVLLFVVFAINAVGAPTESKDYRKPKSPKYALPGQPWAGCEIKDRFLFDSYVIRGSRFNVTQKIFKNAISSGGAAVTAWKWKGTIHPEFGHSFKASFNLPIGMVHKTEKKVANLVKPWELDVHCSLRHDHGKDDNYGINNPPPTGEEDIPWEESDDDEKGDKKGKKKGDKKGKKYDDGFGELVEGDVSE